MSETKTPRTEAFLKKAEKEHYPPRPYHVADFARSLETENARLREALESIYGCAKVLQGFALSEPQLNKVNAIVDIAKSALHGGGEKAE